MDGDVKLQPPIETLFLQHAVSLRGYLLGLLADRAAAEDELFATMADGLVRAWSTESGDATFALATGDVTVTALDVSADGRWLATCGPRGDVKIWQRSEDMRDFAP